MSAALLRSPEIDQPWVASSTSFLSSHLELSYAQYLEQALRIPSPRPHTAPTRRMDSVDGKVSAGAEYELHTVQQLGQALPDILDVSGYDARNLLWGINLKDDSKERSSLLAAFLRAREWDVSRATEFLTETLSWRSSEGINAIDCVEASHDLDDSTLWRDDAIRTAERPGAEGKPRTFVVISMGGVTREGLQQVDAFVRWRIRMQERACAHLGSAHWQRSPRGPTYTLVLDCAGLRPHHFGRTSRRALNKLTYVFTHYYPDLVERTLIVNAPGFLAPMWSVISRLLPAWWGVKIERSLRDLEQREGLTLT